MSELRIENRSERDPVGASFFSGLYLYLLKLLHNWEDLFHLYSQRYVVTLANAHMHTHIDTNNTITYTYTYT